MEEAKLILQNNSIPLLPLVVNNELTNYISFNKIKSFSNKTKLSEIPLYDSHLPYVLPGQHLYDVLKQLKTLDLPLLAVQSISGEYIGIIKTSEVVKAISKSLSIYSTGSILILKVHPKDYSLANIARIIEYNDAKILGVTLFEMEHTSELLVHLKLNTNTLKSILATLERYNYTIHSYFSREDTVYDADERYESLMRFIDL